MGYLIGIDLGTSSLKTVIYDRSGSEIASATATYPIIYPQNGWAEQDPAAWWSACVQTLSQVLRASRIVPSQIKGIGISGQMHGLVMLDAEGQLLRNCIIWCDGRTSVECAEITEKIGAKRLVEITANPALPGFTAGKILWVRKHQPELYDKCRHILLPKDYLRYKLTGSIMTEVSDASGTNLLDVVNRCWSEEVLRRLDIDPALLPEVHESYEVTSYVSQAAASETGLMAGTPVVGGAGDNAATAVGTGIVTKGKLFASIGTSGVLYAHSDTPSIDLEGRVHTFCAAIPNGWTMMGCTLAAGMSLQWFRNQFFDAEIQAAKGLKIDTYALMDQQAEKIPIGANRLLYLPYLMGERSPILDSDARGVFFGLTASHSKYHLLRAVMEGVTYSLNDCLRVLCQLGLKPDVVFATGGGSASPLWRRILADVFNLPVNTTVKTGSAAFGSAILAGVGVGMYPDVPTACEEMVSVNTPERPIAENHTAYKVYYEIYRSLYPALKHGFKRLSKISEEINCE